MRLLILIGFSLLSGCAWIHSQLPGGSYADTGMPRYHSYACSLEQIQARKQLPRLTASDGVPTPLIIHGGSQDADDRLIRSGQWVYFSDAAPATDRARALQSATDPAGAPGPGGAAPRPPTRWWLEALDPNDDAMADGEPLLDRSVVRFGVSQGAGYLHLQPDSGSTSGSAAQATDMGIAKADVPDQTRATTCDSLIRDGDFVYLRATQTNTWVNVHSGGALYTQSTPYSLQPGFSGNNGGSKCARDRERCYTDRSGGLVCVWVPECVN